MRQRARRPLAGDVAREHHQGGALFAHEPQPRRHDEGLLRPKMRIGDLQHHTHGAATLASARDAGLPRAGTRSGKG
jgi:hypothetical protein